MVYTRTPKTKKKDMTYIKEDDFFTMLSAIKEPRYVLIFALLFYCGLRKGELCGLSAPDLIDHELHLHHACKHIKNKGLVISPDLKNEQSRRIVPIPSWIEFDLAAYLGSGDFPFKKEYYHIGVALHRILEDAGLPDMRVHDMRHSYAALLIASGVDIYTVSVLMGHASVQTTSRRYGHLYDEKRKAIAKLFEK
jgi:integrase